MKKLMNFSLLNNKVVNLSTEVCEMVKLRELRIEGQAIWELPEGMKDLCELRVLSLDNNKFKRIPAVVRHYTKLYHFSIAGNEVTGVSDDFFENLLDLEVLGLNNNQLTSLPKSICNLKKLRKLAYENNPGLRLPEWIEVVSSMIESVLSVSIVTTKKKDSLMASFLK